MRESRFIDQNKKKWSEFEEILEERKKDPDKLNDLFIQITDDLSYARTFYPNRSVRVYLNNLAQKVFFNIYKTRQNSRSRFLDFWSLELPQLVWEARPAFRLSFLLFIGSMVIGALSSYMNPEFARIILGDNYVEMTLENIRSGDPMAVYKDAGAFGMSLSITANNLFVALLTFATGALFAIGTIGIMIRNGVMVGTFQYFFVEHDIFWESFLTIWTHGTLEISAIIIAGAAGLTMSSGLVFPGTLSRLKAFQISARRGMKIMVGIAPIIILAGFIEGYLTRHTETPDLIRFGFILLCLAFILFYFVWYPRRLARAGAFSHRPQDPIPVDQPVEIPLGQIRSSGELFARTFSLYRQWGGLLSAVGLGLALLFALLTFSLAADSPSDLFAFEHRRLGTLYALPQFFQNEWVRWLPLVHVLLFTIMVSTVLRQTHRVMLSKPAENPFLAGLKTAIPMALLGLILAFFQWYTVLPILLYLPFLLLWVVIMDQENGSAPRSFSRTWSLLAGQWGRMTGLSLTLLLISLLVFVLMDTMIVYFLFEFIGMNLALEGEQMDRVASIILTITTYFLILQLISVQAIGTFLLFFTLREIREATFLNEQAQKIGLQQRIRGIAKES